MSKYFVSAMIPYSLEVEADSFDEAEEQFFIQGSTDLVDYGGDGIFIKNLETGETNED